MPKVEFRLEEQFADLRSNEVAYKFVVENLSPSAIELLSITPRIPEDVTLLEIRDPSLIALKGKHNELCEQLTTILNNYLITTHQKFREEYLKITKEIFSEVFSEIFRGNAIAAIFRMYMSMVSGAFSKSMESSLRKSGAYRINIENYEQAKEAFDRWLTSSTDTDAVLRNLYEAKMQRLEALEKDMGPNVKTSSLATIESESFFAVTYVLKFRRSRWDPKKYNIAIEGVYSEGGKSQERHHVGGATTSLTISPNPLALTFIAVSASVLGYILKSTVTGGATTVLPQYIALQDAFVFGLQVLASAILALIFFNMYEFTDLGKRLGMGVGWRSALFIGALCGLFGDRILVAVKALIGIS